MTQMNELNGILNELKFFGMREALMHRLGEAEHSSLSHDEFLNLVLQDEKLYRQNRRCEMLRKRAKFNIRASLNDFDLSEKRGISKASINQFKSLYFINANENIVFMGGTGVGKSFLAQAIGYEACTVGIEVFYISTNRLFKEIEIADAQGTYLSYLNRLKNRVKILILDDFGLRNYSHKEANVLYEILEDRYQNAPVIITSQVDPRGWNDLIEDKVIAEAILDRLTACAHIIEIKGSSYRARHKSKTILGKDKK